MRILVLHNRYRFAGGEDAVVAAEISLLRENGFVVREHVATNDSPGGLHGSVELIGASAWSRRSYAELRQVCAQFLPDIAHVHNFWMKLSPSVHEALHDEGIPIVQTLHNFRLICPNSLLLRNGAVCEDCVGKTPWRGVAHRCYRNSLLASAAMARMLIDSARRQIWTDKVDAYIALSEHSRARFVAGGIPAHRIFVKPNFVWPAAAMRSRPENSRSLLYAGRLAEEKGTRLLLEAWAIAERRSARLVIAGDGPLKEELHSLAASLGIADTVDFVGYLAPEAVEQKVARCRAAILPSICLENFPRALVEAFACGRPVIASDLGALRELVDHGRTGLLFRSGDASSLASAMDELLCDDGLTAYLGQAAVQEYEAKYTPAQNLRTLLDVYDFACRSTGVNPSVNSIAKAAICN